MSGLTGGAHYTAGDYCCGLGLIKMKKSNFRLLLLLAFYGLFLILGAAIFSAIESPLEVAEVKNMRERKSHFLRRHTCVTGKFLILFSSTASICPQSARQQLGEAE